MLPHASSCGGAQKATGRTSTLAHSASGWAAAHSSASSRSLTSMSAIPRAERLPPRIVDVLACIYLMFTEGYAATEGELVVRPELCEEAIRLARVMCHAFAREAEARGLLALMLLHHARRDTRTDAEGRLTPLEEQDRGRWDHAAIREGTDHLEEALAQGRPGPYQLQASIAALHAAAARPRDTDWSQIAGLYAELLRRAPSPTAGVALAFAEAMADGPRQGLKRLEDLVAEGLVPATLDRLPAARAELLRRAGQMKEARGAYQEALTRARHPREVEFLRRRAAECG